MRNLWEVMTDIVPVKRVFVPCVCVCTNSGGRSGNGGRGGRERRVCICMGLVRVGNVCGWYACRLWGIRMPCFSLSFCATHTNMQISGWEESWPSCEEPCSINKTHPFFATFPPSSPSPPAPSLFLSLPGSDTEFFLIAVYSLQKPCSPYILHTVPPPPSIFQQTHN